MQVEIKFKRTGSHSVYGNFAAGDLMRCNADLAAFWVREGVAKYATAPAAPEVKPTPVRKPKQAKEKS